MAYRITLLPDNRSLYAGEGENLLAALRRAEVMVDAPCGGMGRCGKCKAVVNGHTVLACRTAVGEDMQVFLPGMELPAVTAPDGDPATAEGGLLAFDIGTTTVVGYLLDGKNGQELACESCRNPQTAYGADVISRVRHALKGNMNALRNGIRDCLEQMSRSLCERAGISCDTVTVVSVVGNPAMQQLFLGILPENLARIPYAPVITRGERVDAGEYLPCCPQAKLLLVPNIGGFVGTDTVACVIASGMDRAEELTLLVDIGTNGEMVLGNRERMVACSAAAGPALEGANIRWGMRWRSGAIDRVWLENDSLSCHVLGDGEAQGICGSGIVDAVAAALDAGWLNRRGKILRSDGIIPLTGQICLTQEDIRQVQAAKGAIAAGIVQMAAHLGVSLEEIGTVYLAGAFGSCLNPGSACRMGLLPAVLEGRIHAMGNGAGSGAKMLAVNPRELNHACELTRRIEFLELATSAGFQRCFAGNMRF